MPFKSGKKGSGKTESVLKIIFKRYNPEKVTINGLKNFFAMVFYKTGVKIEKTAQLFAQTAAKVFGRIGRRVMAAFRTAADFLDKLTDTILDDLGEPLDKAGSAFSRISEIIKETRASWNSCLNRCIPPPKEIASFIIAFISICFLILP